MSGGGVKETNIIVRGGADGATYTPYIDEDGYLHFNNDKGFPNPLPQKVVGERGDNGLSAYEIAVKNGFTGSEQEWLETLGGGITYARYDKINESMEIIGLTIIE